jgi:hypothetical protein
VACHHDSHSVKLPSLLDNCVANHIRRHGRRHGGIIPVLKVDVVNLSGFILSDACHTNGAGRPEHKIGQIIINASEQQLP